MQKETAIPKLINGLKKFLSERRDEYRLIDTMLESLQALANFDSDVKALRREQTEAKKATERTREDLKNVREDYASSAKALKSRHEILIRTNQLEKGKLATELSEASTDHNQKIDALVAVYEVTKTAHDAQIEAMADKLAEAQDALSEDLQNLYNEVDRWKGKLTEAESDYESFLAKHRG